ncbi:MAG: hypothetical protein KME16_13015 [Scytolyngbya sp. HA4215-MV1]|jgi:hypothetical protein|nr:hypothetical protein [Scytolyngbya sp. HA4215-MV1]
MSLNKLAEGDAWQKVVSAALLGTDRQPFTLPTAPGQLGQFLPQLAHLSSEATLLTAAAALALHKHAGWLPPQLPVPAPIPHETGEPYDDLPRCSPRAARLLQQMLQGQHAVVLPEWLILAAQRGQRVPELELPELLDLGKQRRDLRAKILWVLGQRGRWLAAQNPEWKYAVTVATEEDWETGHQAARELYFQDLRANNPDRARELLQTTWKQEVASDRAKFLETFSIGLSMADEPFLTAGLNDRGKEVRRVAADLLARLPDAPLSQHIATHTTRYLTLVPQPTPTLQVELPDTLNASLIQAGIEPKLAQPISEKLGEKAGWLFQLIGATPLTVWEDWGMTPVEIVALVRNHEWEGVLLGGWALAAQRQQRSEWSEALLNRWLTENSGEMLPGVSLENLFEILPNDTQDQFLTQMLSADRNPLSDSRTLWFLRQSRQEWSAVLAHWVLLRLEAQIAQTAQSPTNYSWELWTALKDFARFMPVSLLPEAIKLQTLLPAHSPWSQSLEAFLTLLQFRQDIVQAFEIAGGS